MLPAFCTWISMCLGLSINFSTNKRSSPKLDLASWDESRNPSLIEKQYVFQILWSYSQLYHIHFEITGDPCNLIASNSVVTELNRKEETTFPTLFPHHSKQFSFLCHLHQRKPWSWLDNLKNNEVKPTSNQECKLRGILPTSWLKCAWVLILNHWQTPPGCFRSSLFEVNIPWNIFLKFVISLF